MTDKEIIKNLEWYREQKLFAFIGEEDELYIRDILDLINRQQAKIEIQEKVIKVLDIITDKQDYYVKKAESEAIKEFMHNLERYTTDYEIGEHYILWRNVESVANEMAGEG